MFSSSAGMSQLLLKNNLAPLCWSLIEHKSKLHLKNLFILCSCDEGSDFIQVKTCLKK